MYWSCLIMNKAIFNKNENKERYFLILDSYLPSLGIRSTQMDFKKSKYISEHSEPELEEKEKALYIRQ